MQLKKKKVFTNHERARESKRRFFGVWSWNKIVLYSGLIPVNHFGCLTIVTLNLKKKKRCGIIMNF